MMTMALAATVLRRMPLPLRLLRAGKTLVAGAAWGRATLQRVRPYGLLLGQSISVCSTSTRGIQPTALDTRRIGTAVTDRMVASDGR